MLGALATLGASLIGGVGSGVSSAISSKAMLQAQRETNEMNYRISQETNAANKALYEQQFADSIKAWNMQNEYNAPVKEVQRLRAAGLNPALTFGDAAQAGSVSMPSASPAVGAEMHTAPYDAYSDTFAKGMLDAMPQIAATFESMNKAEQTNIDNQTRKAMNLKQLDQMDATIDELLSRGNVNEAQKRYLNETREYSRLMRTFMEDTYDSSVQKKELETKFQELMNQQVNQQMANDAARLAIEKAESLSKRHLNDAQISSINTLANLAVNADWRASQEHVWTGNLKALDEQLKRLDIDETAKQNVFNEIMRKSEEVHTGLKDSSLLNKFVEAAFGLGFRDVGRALQNLLGK